MAQSLSGESIDLLINNAGIYTTSPAGDFGNADYEAWMRAFRINTLVPLYKLLCRESSEAAKKLR